MDCYSKKIIGYAIAGNMRTRLVAEALHMAVRNCPVTRGETVFHSDRGSQYTSADYAEIMNTYGIRASVGRIGSCYDNAAAESFNTLKFIHSYGQPGSDEGVHHPSATHE